MESNTHQNAKQSNNPSPHMALKSSPSKVLHETFFPSIILSCQKISDPGKKMKPADVKPVDTVPFELNDVFADRAPSSNIYIMDPNIFHPLSGKDAVKESIYRAGEADGCIYTWSGSEVNSGVRKL